MTSGQNGRPSIGLALGAGGTKGTAHVGVLKVLQEAGVPIDCVAGASIGAAYGAAWLAGYPIERMEEDVLATTPRDVLAFFAHRLRLDAASLIGRGFHSLLKDLTFSDLRLPFAAVASDLFERRRVVIRSGPLLRAVQASIAVPLMAQPVRWGDRYLVDGGFWEQAPVDVAAGMGAARIIDVVLGESINLPAPLRPFGRAALRQLSGAARRMGPGNFAAAVFLLFTLLNPPHSEHKADVTIRPDVIRISANSPFHLQMCMRRGEEAARAALPEIKALTGAAF
ncbi:MAG: patatin-like phospholipase family protein [Dehalococcoidia bacterium]|nr:patatin-like phospholipase family protein [Dehalococcoidia bacterium]